MTRDELAGGFAWTGFDYRGEPSPYAWPCISSHFGIIDTCGFPKDVFWYYRSFWQKEPVLHLLPHWNWPGKEGQEIDVWCFTNYARVSLTLNGKALGERDVPALGHAQWKVPYEPGVLEAAVLDGDRKIATAKVETTGASSRLALSREPTRARPDRRDAMLVTVSALDVQGRPVPTASDEVSFVLEGPGEIIGVGNGDPSSHEPDRFVARLASREVGGWRTAPLDAIPRSAPRIADLEKLQARDLDATRDATSIRAVGAAAAYWTTLRVEDGDLAANALSLSIGRIDDHGMIYLDGKQVAESHAWDRPVSVDLTGKLGIGAHDLVVVVRNDNGPGGLGRGVTLTSQMPAPQWKRRLFSGLAQVIIRPRPGDGDLKLRASAPGVEPAELVLPVPEP